MTFIASRTTLTFNVAPSWYDFDRHAIAEDLGPVSTIVFAAGLHVTNLATDPKGIHVTCMVTQGEQLTDIEATFVAMLAKVEALAEGNPRRTQMASMREGFRLERLARSEEIRRALAAGAPS